MHAHVCKCWYLKGRLQTSKICYHMVWWMGSNILRNQQSPS